MQNKQRTSRSSFFYSAITSYFASPSPIPEFSNTPQENHMADDKVRASSSSSSLFTLNLPNGLEEGDHKGCIMGNERLYERSTGQETLGRFRNV